MTDINSQEIFNYIMSQKLNDITREIDGVIYKVRTDSSLLVFATNIILLIEEKRLMFRTNLFSNLDDHYNLFNKLSDMINIMDIPYPECEPSIILTSNYDKVAKVLLTDEDHHIKIGKLLGYHYTGEDWYKLEESYSISYIIEYNNIKGYLYSYNIPKYYYNQDVKNNILNDVEKYQSSLSKLNIKIKVSCMYFDNDLNNNSDPIITDLP